MYTSYFQNVWINNRFFFSIIVSWPHFCLQDGNTNWPKSGSWDNAFLDCKSLDMFEIKFYPPPRSYFREMSQNRSSREAVIRTPSKGKVSPNANFQPPPTPQRVRKLDNCMKILWHIPFKIFLIAIALRMRKRGKKRETRAIRSWQKFSKWGNGGKRRKRECTFSKRPTQWKRRWEKTFHKVVQHFISFTPIHQQNISHFILTFYKMRCNIL